MAGKLLIPIDGYIEAQEFWHKMKKSTLVHQRRRQRRLPLIPSGTACSRPT